MNAIIKTSKGDMKVEFYVDDAPNTVANFIKLAENGYYDGLKWQWGDSGLCDSGWMPKYKRRRRWNARYRWTRLSN